MTTKLLCFTHALKYFADVVEIQELKRHSSSIHGQCLSHGGRPDVVLNISNKYSRLYCFEEKVNKPAGTIVFSEALIRLPATYFIRTCKLHASSMPALIIASCCTTKKCALNFAD